MVSECRQGAAIARHPVVLVVPFKNRLQPFSGFPYGLVHPSAHFLGQGGQLGPLLLGHGRTQHAVFSTTRLAAGVRKSEKVERLGFLFASSSPVRVRKAAKLDEARLLLVERKT